MASISTDENGNRRILFKHVDGTRQAVYLGQVPMSVATEFKRHIGLILIAKKTGQMIESATIAWIAGLSDDLHAKLLKHGLVEPRVAVVEKERVDSRPTLDAFLKAYIDGRTDLKPRTKINLEQARKELVKFFGASRLLAAITPADADEFRRSMASRLGENTIRRHCGRAKQFFRYAFRKRMINESPFADMKHTKVRSDQVRKSFVDVPTIQKVLDACPDAQWRVIVALARFGGLRCPSEVLSLKWS